MLKKILGQAPFDVTLDKNVVITPGKKCAAALLFSNTSEYDLPLSCSLNFSTSVDVDKTAFDVTVPAEGKTQVSLTFSKDDCSRMFTGKATAELEILDRIFDSKTLYEFDILCEAAYKCDDGNDGFLPTEDIIFSNGGVFFANCGEKVYIQIPLMEEKEFVLRILSGKIAGKTDGESFTLTQGLNRLSFEMLEDGSFYFEDPVSCEKIYIDTIGTKYFI